MWATASVVGDGPRERRPPNEESRTRSAAADARRQGGLPRRRSAGGRGNGARPGVVGDHQEAEADFSVEGGVGWRRGRRSGGVVGGIVGGPSGCRRPPPPPPPAAMRLRMQPAQGSGPCVFHARATRRWRATRTARAKASEEKRPLAQGRRRPVVVLKPWDPATPYLKRLRARRSRRLRRLPRRAQVVWHEPGVLPRLRRLSARRQAPQGRGRPRPHVHRRARSRGCAAVPHRRPPPRAGRTRSTSPSTCSRRCCACGPRSHSRCATWRWPTAPGPMPRGRKGDRLTRTVLARTTSTPCACSTASPSGRGTAGSPRSR